jgi:acyl-coenzyme A thioesterase PaaI-like protein
MMENGRIPKGFSPCRFEVPVPFSDGMDLYHRVHDQGVVIGVWVQDKYRNGGQMAHGGFLMALGDIATGHATSELMGKDRYTVHVSFNMNFYSSVPIGCWLEVHGKVNRRGREVVFASCEYLVDGALYGRADAVLKSSLPRAGRTAVRDA